jgi:hypothetical protein
VSTAFVGGGKGSAALAEKVMKKSIKVKQIINLFTQNRFY